MADNYLFNLAQMDQGKRDSKPIAKREIFKTADKSNGVYTVNQIVIETIDFSSNGRYMNLYESEVQIPIVAGVSAISNLDGVTAVPLTGINDILFVPKSNLGINLIHNLSIEYANSTVIASCDNINMLLNYKLHTEKSMESEELNIKTGYTKDTSTSWSFSANPSGCGQGLCNNMNNLSSVENYYDNTSLGRTSNSTNLGMLKRQEFYFNSTRSGPGRDALFNTNSVREEGLNYVESVGNSKIYYLTATLRLRDLPFFEKLNMLVRGANIRLIFNLNSNISFTVIKGLDGNLTLSGNSIQNSVSACNPWMVPASRMLTTSAINVSAGNTVGTSLTTQPGLICGSLSEVPNSTNLNYSFKIQKNTIGGVNYEHILDRIYLYAPAYTLFPEYDQLYLQVKNRKILYEDYEYSNVDCGASRSVQHVITAGASRMKSLLVVPIMTQTDNAGINPLSSPFTCEPVYCSPCAIKDLQIYMGGDGLFREKLNFSNEQYKYMYDLVGMNANLIEAQVSSRISYQDYINTYGYIYVDLSKKSEDQINSIYNLRFECKNNGLKGVTFHFFLAREKEITIDVNTGVRLDN